MPTAIAINTLIRILRGVSRMGVAFSVGESIVQICRLAEISYPQSSVGCRCKICGCCDGRGRRSRELKA
jgi:hypothetical protein